jgi:hypothetical protein
MVQDIQGDKDELSGFVGLRMDRDISFRVAFAFASKPYRIFPDKLS